ncbi:MAG: hypothetical protein H0U12_03200 [Thermoleophilaceae bacterium]|nr:hypothetical protein [Thermoleophilaceae bacterium]
MPKSTVYDWARKSVAVPSVSSVSVKLWSYSDLMGLRTIQWLRHEKKAPSGADVPATSMPKVRRALKTLQQLDLTLWTEQEDPVVAVDRAGEVYVNAQGRPLTTEGQALLDADLLDLVRPFSIDEGARGPDLHAPRPSLRIVPGKLSGSPHVHRSRVETQALAALSRRLSSERVYELYPDLDRNAVDEALDLEWQLEDNLVNVA